MSATDPTPTLAEFVPRYRADDNEWWRLECGHHQNLFEEAVEELSNANRACLALDREVMDLRRAVREFIGDISRSAMGEPIGWKSYKALREALDG